jgi:hypothetical protein
MLEEKRFDWFGTVEVAKVEQADGNVQTGHHNPEIEQRVILQNLEGASLHFAATNDYIFAQAQGVVRLNALLGIADHALFADFAGNILEPL